MPLDIAFGIYLAIAANFILDIPLTAFTVMLLVLFTLSPDLDAVFYVIKKGKMDDEHHHHRNLMHYPLIFIPLGAVLITLMFGKEYAFLFVMASFFHFIHDSIGMGWGVRWLYPFSKKNFTFFYQFDIWNKLPRKLVYSWSPDELRIMLREYANPNWVKEIYLKPHPYAIFEYVNFIVAIILLIYYL